MESGLKAESQVEVCACIKSISSKEKRFLALLVPESKLFQKPRRCQEDQIITKEVYQAKRSRYGVNP